VEAIRAEVRLLVESKAFFPASATLVNKQVGSGKMAMLRSSLFFKERSDRSLKCTVMVKASRQQLQLQLRSIQGELTCPKVEVESLFLTAAQDAAEGRSVIIITIEDAYMQSKVESSAVVELEPQLTSVLLDVYPQHKSYKDNKGRMLVKLEKALFGGLEAEKLCFAHLSNTLHFLGFVPSPQDPCVLNKRIAGGFWLTIAMHLNELKASCADMAALDELVAQLMAVYSAVSVQESEVLDFLGMKLSYSEPGVCHINMTEMIEGIMKENDVEGMVVTPAVDDLFVVQPTSDRINPKLNHDETLKFVSVVQKLRYVAKRGRPDILVAICFLSTRTTFPAAADQKKLDRVLKYLNGTRNLFLRLSFAEGLAITATEDAFMAPIDVALRAKWVDDFVRTQGVEAAPNMLTEHKGASGGASARPCLISIRLSFVQNKYAPNSWKVQNVRVEKVPSEYDFKPAQGELFRKQRLHLMNCHEGPEQAHFSKALSHKPASAVESKSKAASDDVHSLQARREVWMERFKLFMMQYRYWDESVQTHGPMKIIDAIRAEVKQLIDQKAFHPVTAKEIEKENNEGGKVGMLKILLVFKEKIDRALKCTMLIKVPKLQQTNVNLSPLPTFEALFLATAQEATEGRSVIVINLEDAYLQSKIETNSVVELDVQLVNILTELCPAYQSYRDSQGQVMMKLDKALCGSMESDLLCYRHVSSTLQSLGFAANPQDPCVLNRHGNRGMQLTVTMHLNELKASCADKTALNELVAQLMAVYTAVSVQEGEVLDFLGMTFSYSEPGVCNVHMSSMVEEIVKDNSVEGIGATPAIDDLFVAPLISLKNPRLAGGEHGRFISIMQKLRVMSSRVRPDILVPISFLATRTSGPTKADKKKLDRVLKYLNGTPALSLRLGFVENFFLTT
ncbi:hypothetical protein EON64_12220, partial [archaeon]